MGALLSAGRTSSSDPPVRMSAPVPPTAALPAWLTVLENCPRMDIATWEDSPYTGGSVHSHWTAQLLSAEAVTTLGSLDPVVIASAPHRVDPTEHSELLRSCGNGIAFRFACHSYRLQTQLQVHAQEALRRASPKMPYALSTDPSIASYRLCGVVHDESNVVLEYDTGTSVTVLWVWALQQLGVHSEGLLRLIIDMAHDLGDSPCRWLYVMLSGYKFKGRLPGCSVRNWFKPVQGASVLDPAAARVTHL